MLKRFSGFVPLLCISILALEFSAASANAQVSPRRITVAQINEAPYSSTGLVFSTVGGFQYRGSGAVARDPRLLYTCAHVIYDSGRWATLVEFARAYNSISEPADSVLQPARGQFYFSTYSGGDGARDFNLDFAVAYAPQGQSFGPALNYYLDAGADIRSSATSKMILGYPSRLDRNGAQGHYFQHQTGPFQKGLYQELVNYHGADQISTGAGNSGGPVLILRNGQYELAGILVSGSKTSIGVYVLNPEANNIATRALAAAGGSAPTPSPTPGPTPSPTPPPVQGEEETRSISNAQASWIPDARYRFTMKALRVFRMPRMLTAAVLDAEVTTTYAGDLDIYLRSPRGRVMWLHEADFDNDAENVVLSDVDLSDSLLGSNPNGLWRFFVRDIFRGDRARFENVALTLTSQ